MAAVGARAALVGRIISGSWGVRARRWSRPTARQEAIVVAVAIPCVLVGPRVVPVAVSTTHGVGALVRAEGALHRETTLLKQGLVGDLGASVATSRKIDIAGWAPGRCHPRWCLTAGPEGARARAILIAKPLKTGTRRARRGLQCGVPSFAAQPCDGAGETTRRLDRPEEALGQPGGHLQAVGRMEREPRGSLNGTAGPRRRDPGGARVVAP